MSNFSKEVEVLMGDSEIREALFDGYLYSHSREALENAGIEALCVDRHGGEGQGEDYWKVWKLTNGEVTVYVELTGSYASYDGSEFDSWSFVHPVEVLVTQYHAGLE